MSEHTDVTLAPPASRPLDGIRVLDLTANVAGPLACQVLADLGAEVIKVEPPVGEAARHITASAPGADRVTPYFSPNNRGKSSVRLDLSDPADVSALRNLVRSADVLVQGMRPGTMSRRGLGPDDVAALNPRCVYASISAYGGGSELENRAGVDMMVQAEAGCLSGQPRDEPPRLIPFQLVDGATGHVVAQAVLAALLHRERTGVVNAVDVAMYDVACSLQSNHLTLHMNSAPRSGEARAPRRALAVEPSGVYPTKTCDVVLSAYVPAHWSRLLTVLGRPELASDPRFADQEARARHSADLRSIITDVLVTRPGEEWVAELTACGLMASTVTTWRDVVTSELFTRRRLRLVASQSGRQVQVLRTPALYSSFDTTVERQIPAAGEHEETLRSLLAE